MVLGPLGVEGRPSRVGSPSVVIAGCWLWLQLCQEWVPRGRWLKSPQHELWSSAETVALTSTRILARRNLVEFNLFTLMFITHFPSLYSQQKSDGGI